MKIRKIKKSNKKRLNKILLDLPFEIVSKKFLSGYFIFSHSPCSIVHFKVRNDLYNGFKFGIWLNDDGFRVFAEHESCIDKFKPGASTFYGESIIDFLLKLDKYFDDEYSENIKRSIAYDEEMRVINFNNYVNIQEVLKSCKTDEYSFKIIDKYAGSCFTSTSKYEIQLWIEDHVEDDEDKKNIFLTEVFRKILEVYDDKDALMADDYCMLDEWIKHPSDYLLGELAK